MEQTAYEEQICAVGSEVLSGSQSGGRQERLLL